MTTSMMVALLLAVAVTNATQTNTFRIPSFRTVDVDGVLGIHLDAAVAQTLGGDQAVVSFDFHDTNTPHTSYVGE
jgi:hypothetical protein